MEKHYPVHHVPCDGCTLCCQGDAVRLRDEDIPKHYITEPHPLIPGAFMLAHAPNGDCIYLGKNGCRIHDHAPSLCRTADCRSLAARFDFAAAMQLHAAKKIDIRVWDQGHKLLERLAMQESTKRNDPSKTTSEKPIISGGHNDAQD